MKIAFIPNHLLFLLNKDIQQNDIQRYHINNLATCSIEASETTDDKSHNLPSLIGFPKIISHGVKKNVRSSISGLP